MKVIKPDSLSLLYAPFPRLPGLEGNPRDYTLSLALLLGFPFVTQGEIPPFSEQDLWEVIQNSLADDEILDIGLPKPRAEFLVYGSCHPPEAQRGAEVLVQVAGLEKRLLVLGDRQAGGADMAEPRAFASMPVTWRQAYGGPDFPENPLGKGHKPLPGGKRQLPNLQYSDRTALQREGGEVPASFTAMPPHWPQRRRHLGTVGESWLQNHWPGLPADYSHEYACCAPKDQRLQAFFRGGEAFALHGMHPHKSVLRGLLPPVRGRLFLLRKNDAAECFEEVSCRLETLWLFPEQEAGVLLCRGVSRTVDEECADILAVLAAMENGKEMPLPCEHYERLCRESLQPAAPPLDEEVDAASPAEEEKAPSGAKSAAAAGVAAVTATPAFQELQEFVQQVESGVREYLQGQGLAFEDMEQEFERRSPPPQVEDVQQKSQQELTQELEEHISDIERKTDAFLEEQGLDKEHVLRKLQEPSGISSEEEAKYLEELRALQQKEHLPPEIRNELGKIIESQGQLQAVLGQIAAFGLSMRKEREAAQEQAAQQAASPEPLTEAAPAMSEPLKTEEALERFKDGRGLADCDLTHCDFSGQDLSGADLSRAVCSNVAWPGVTLTNACLAGANFQEADLSDAVLDNADCSRTVFEKARLDRCSAKKAMLHKAQLQFASLVMADLEHALCNEADASSTDLSSARLHGLQGREMRLSGAVMAGQRLLNADLTGSRADADTNMRGARFENCTLDAICWGGAQLTEVRFLHCSLDRGDLARADLRQALLQKVQARHAVLLKADLTQARLNGVNLFQASLRWADCSGTRMRNVNLFGADLYRCRISPDLLDDVNSKRTLLDPSHFGGGYG